MSFVGRVDAALPARLIARPGTRRSTACARAADLLFAAARSSVEDLRRASARARRPPSGCSVVALLASTSASSACDALLRRPSCRPLTCSSSITSPRSMTSVVAEPVALARGLPTSSPELVLVLDGVPAMIASASLLRAPLRAAASSRLASSLELCRSAAAQLVAQLGDARRRTRFSRRVASSSISSCRCSSARFFACSSTVVTMYCAK